jgi:hypothetical protein
MAYIPHAPLAAALCLLSLGALAAPAGTVLFTQPGSQIVDANGVPRPAQRGDVLQHGDKLQTPRGGISQVRMLDGSILGVRPATELRFDPPAGNVPTVVSLLQGSVRVIASELMDNKRPSAMTLMSGQATLQLKGADVETTVVTDKQPGTTDPGSYSRLITGTASIAKGSLVEPLSALQVSFVGDTTGRPITLPTSPGELFGNKGGTRKIGTTPSLNSDGKRNGGPNMGIPKSDPTPSTPKPIILTTHITLQPPRLPLTTCTITRSC